MNYEQQFRVPTASVGANTRIRLTPLLAMLQEVASIHAAQLGLGYDVLMKERRAFVLSRIDIHCKGPLPTWGDRITLRTWPRGLDRLMALRDFIGYREDGSVFLRSSSAWVIVDVDRHRPMRPMELLGDLPANPEKALSADAPTRLDWQDGLAVADSRRARYSDLDPNQHVNNTRYGDWIRDALHAPAGPEMDIRSLKINYLGEIRLGEEVEIAAIEIEPSRFIVQGASSKRHFVAEIVLR